LTNTEQGSRQDETRRQYGEPMTSHLAATIAAEAGFPVSFVAIAICFVAASIWVAAEASRCSTAAFVGTPCRRWCYQMAPVLCLLGFPSLLLIGLWIFNRSKIKMRSKGGTPLKVAV
jgi:hypothetical protein